MPWWSVVATASGVIAVAYLAISFTILSGLVRTGQVRTNRLGLATALIFGSCGLGHGQHLYHLLEPVLGGDVEVGEAARLAADWHLGFVDAATAGIAVWYWTLRSRFGPLVSGPQMFTDEARRRARAERLDDEVVQGLVTAKLALEVGDPDLAAAQLETTLGRARALVGALAAEAAPAAAANRPDGSAG